MPYNHNPKIIRHWKSFNQVFPQGRTSYSVHEVIQDLDGNFIAHVYLDRESFVWNYYNYRPDFFKEREVGRCDSLDSAKEKVNEILKEHGYIIIDEKSISML